MNPESHSAPDDADILFRNARIVDGSGGPSFTGDLAVKDDRIVAVGPLGDIRAGVTIDCGGKVLSPGFIDVHTHDDRCVLSDPLIPCKISQGVTTVVTGNCGVSIAPLRIGQRPPPPLDLLGESPDDFFPSFAAYLDRLDEAPPAVNVAPQVGHSSLRVGVMDRLDRAATADEIKAMCRMLDRSLDEGAIGFSTGLFYAPANAAPTEEVIEIARVLKDYGALHTTHMRDEADRVMDSIDETIRIGREAQVPVVISHHKCAGAANFNRSTETLAAIDAARAGQPLGLDVYPYAAGSTVLDVRRFGKAMRIMISWSRAMPEMAGRDLADIAAELGVDELKAAERLQPAGAIYFMMDEVDVRRIMQYPHSMIGSDGLPHDEHPHPRLWGTFPRVLGHYCREVGLFPLETAVHKMTGLSAAHFNLTDRGVIRAGAFADLVLFDPEVVEDRSTYETPLRHAAGIELVMVNGRVAWRDEQPTGERPGRALRRQA